MTGAQIVVDPVSDPLIKRLRSGLLDPNGRRLSLRQSARLIGVHASTLSRICSGQRPLTSDIRLRLLDKLAGSDAQLRDAVVQQFSRLELPRLAGVVAATDRGSACTAWHSPPVGERCFGAAVSLADAGQMQQAIAAFRRAEELLGPDSPSSARAALEVGRLLTNLTCYGAATEQLRQTRARYRPVIDDRTDGEIELALAWIDYHSARIPQSRARLTRLAEKGAEDLGLKRATEYLLGRLFMALGDLASGRAAFRAALAAPRDDRLADEGAVLLREAQLELWHPLGDAVRGRELFLESNRTFTAVDSSAYLSLEKARLAAASGETRNARVEIDAAIGLWTQMPYARGVAEALMVLGLVALEEGGDPNLEYAVECLAVAEILRPDGTNVGALSGSCREVRERIVGAWRRRFERKTRRRYVGRLHERALRREGVSAIVRLVPGLDDAHLSSVFEQLV